MQRFGRTEDRVIKNNCPPLDSGSKTFAVRNFFDQTDRYLVNNGNIEIRRRVVRDLVGEIQSAKILDLGCGDGSIALQFLSLSNSLTLVDISSNMLEIARNQTPPALKMNVEYVNNELGQYQSSSKYDLVLCLGILAHVDVVENAIRKIADLVKPEGRCVLQMTDDDRILGKLSGLYCDFRNRLKRRYPTTLNRTGVRGIRSLAAQFNMACLAERRYASLLPAMGRMPLSWRSRYQLLTLNTPWLSRHGSEAILLFSKTA